VEAAIVHLAEKRKTGHGERLNGDGFAKKKDMPMKRTTRRTSERKRNSPEMSEAAGKARRTIAGSSPERKLR
jgi:hypothetical protein